MEEGEEPEEGADEGPSADEPEDAGTAEEVRSSGSARLSGSVRSSGSVKPSGSVGPPGSARQSATVVSPDGAGPSAGAPVAPPQDKSFSKPLEDFAEAYKNARTDPECGDILGAFLVDLVRLLGVRLPRLQKDEEHPPFVGEPVDVECDNLGPGTVGWEAERALRPTLSSLELTLEGLEAKCRLKDRLINRLADELRRLAECTGREDRLRESLSDAGQPADPPDYDRTTLFNHLLGKPPTSFSSSADQKYEATNPLALRVTRQVGADSLLIEWNLPPPRTVHSYEVFVNGNLMQRIRSASRTKALLHPVDVKEKIFITLNTLNYKGEVCDAYNISYFSKSAKLCP